MRVTVMGVMIVAGVALLIAFVVGLMRGSDETGKN